MAFDFDAPVERAGTWSTRWERYAGRDVIPLWVADSDFRAPPAVLEALAARVAHGVFGYTTAPAALTEAICERLERRRAWRVEPSWIVYLSGVVPGLHLAARKLVPPDGHVLVPRPVYQHLKRAAELAPRRFTEIPLVLDRGRWVFDPQDLRQDADLFFVQSAEPRRHGVPPPGARAARRGERSRDHRVRRDPLRPGPRPGAAPRADCEPFTRGLAPHGHADVGEQDLQFPCRRLRLGDHRGRPAAAHVRRRHRGARAASPSVFGYDATLAAFRGGDAWLAAQLEYLRGNRDLSSARLGYLWLDVEATYLAWIDCSTLGAESAYEYFLQRGVALSPGPQFGGSAGFVRLNFATQRARLAEALARMRAAAARPAPR